MNKSLGKLEKVDPREYWKDEARDFTPWLAQEENLELSAAPAEIPFSCLNKSPTNELAIMVYPFL